MRSFSTNFGTKNIYRAPEQSVKLREWNSDGLGVATSARCHC